jgi:hypothetical protein
VGPIEGDDMAKPSMDLHLCIVLNGSRYPTSSSGADMAPSALEATNGRGVTYGTH